MALLLQWKIQAAVLLLMAMTSVSAEEVIDDDESWFMERFYRDSHGRGMTVTSATTKREQKIMWSGIQSCDVPVPVKQGHDSTDDLLPQSSTCPWNWVINIDRRRTPSTLLVAHCACQKCLSTGSEDHRCRPVHYFRPVTYDKGTALERTKLYRLAVGCTCERHSTHSMV